MRAAFGGLLICCFAGLSQISNDSPRFEAASVKRSDPKAPPSPPNTCTGGPGTSDPGMLRCTNAALSVFVLQAYDVKYYELISPDWVIHGGAETGYDVAAKIPPGTTKPQYQAMLRSLLADRFHLVAHRETRELPVYALTPGKGKPRLTPSAGPAEPGKRRYESFFVRGHFEWTYRNATLASLAGALETQLWSPVSDETGLSGEYDFTLTFMPDEKWKARAGWNRPDTPGDDTPNLFGAVSDQLGLKLEPRKGPVTVLVVDSANKTPVEN